MAGSGSISEWQEFFMTGTKPLYRFRDRALAGIMAARGWIVEGQLSQFVCNQRKL
jgi:hypothetical protein